MTTGTHYPLFRTFRGFAASLLLLGVGACGQEPPPQISANPAAAPPVTTPSAQTKPAAAPQLPVTATGAASNQALAARVKQALVARKVPHARSIDVDASGGVVRLFGAVGSSSERDQAAEVTAGVEGVETVENKLAIAAGS